MALDRGRELELALGSFLLERLPVERRVLERDRGLGGEQAERLGVGGRERRGAAAHLPLREGEDTETAAPAHHRHRESARLEQAALR